jgi:hypothetical protein
MRPVLRHGPDGPVQDEETYKKNLILSLSKDGRRGKAISPDREMR